MCFSISFWGVSVFMYGDRDCVSVSLWSWGEGFGRAGGWGGGWGGILVLDIVCVCVYVYMYVPECATSRGCMWWMCVFA